MSRTRTLATVLPLALALAGASAAPALASGGGGGVRAAGACSATSHWTLKAKHDNGRIEVEAQVDSNRAGQTWRWSLLDGSTVVARGTAQTTAPSGSFSVVRRTANRPGTDVIGLRATGPRGETCSGTVRV